MLGLVSKNQKIKEELLVYIRSAQNQNASFGIEGTMTLCDCCKKDCWYIVTDDCEKFKSNDRS